VASCLLTFWLEPMWRGSMEYRAHREDISLREADLKLAVCNAE
jgi:hypothetical protein